MVAGITRSSRLVGITRASHQTWRRGCLLLPATPTFHHPTFPLKASRPFFLSASSSSPLIDVSPSSAFCNIASILFCTSAVRTCLTAADFLYLSHRIFTFVFRFLHVRCPTRPRARVKLLIMPACSAAKAIKKKRSSEQLCIEKFLIGNKRAKLDVSRPSFGEGNSANLAENQHVDDTTQSPTELQNEQQKPLIPQSGGKTTARRTRKAPIRSRNSCLTGEGVATCNSESIGNKVQSNVVLHGNDDGDALDKPDEQGPNLTAKPLYKLREIIQHLLEASLKDGLQDFVEAGQHFIRVGTLCSGTDAPLHVMNLFGMLKNTDGERVFTAINVFGCEIEPFKQGFLMRNSKPQFLFRDARDFAADGARKA